jgi:hypothetical protein
MFVVLYYQAVKAEGHLEPCVYGPFGQEQTARNWAEMHNWIDYQVLPLEEA